MEEIRWKSDREKYEQNIKELQQKVEREKKLHPPKNQNLWIYDKWMRKNQTL